MPVHAGGLPLWHAPHSAFGRALVALLLAFHRMHILHAAVQTHGELHVDNILSFHIGRKNQMAPHPFAKGRLAAGELRHLLHFETVPHCRTIIGACARTSPGSAKEPRATARGWPGLAKLIAIEDRNDGSTLLVYRATLDEVHVRSRHAPLSANDALTIVDQPLVEIDAMHEAGIIHPGISTSAIERRRSDYGFMSARLRGVGLPPLPGRSAEDDLYDLAATIDAMVVWGDEADDNGLNAALERALGPVEDRFKTAGEMLLAVRGAPRPRSGHRIQQGTMPGMRNAVARNTQRMLAMDVSLAG